MFSIFFFLEKNVCGWQVGSPKHMRTVSFDVKTNGVLGEAPCWSTMASAAFWWPVPSSLYLGEEMGGQCTADQSVSAQCLLLHVCMRGFSILSWDFFCFVLFCVEAQEKKQKRKKHFGVCWLVCVTAHACLPAYLNPQLPVIMSHLPTVRKGLCSSLTPGSGKDPVRLDS